MTARRIRILSSPASVPVSDDRSRVDGAAVEIYTDVGAASGSQLIIPPEGPEPGAWLGSKLSAWLYEYELDTTAVYDALGRAAALGAIGQEHQEDVDVDA